MPNKTPHKQPKILLLVHETLFGGGTRQTFYILEELIRSGYQTVLFSNAKHTWLGSRIRQTNLPVAPYYSNCIQRNVNPFKEIMVALLLVGIIIKERPDVIMTSGVKLSCIGCFIGWLCGVRKRFFIIRGEGAPPGPHPLKYIYLLQRFLSLLGTRFVSVTHYIEHEMIKHRACREHQIHTVYDGTDIRLFSQDKPGNLKEQLKLPHNAFIIAMPGRLHPARRFDQFIAMMEKICAQHPHVYGLLIGEGQDRHHLQQLIDQSDYSDRILITGFMNGMQFIYPHIDITVLFSRHEGCANVLLESLACEIPIITNDICGNKEIALHGENGYVVNNGDIDQAVAYATALIKNTSQRKQLGSRGRQLSEKQFNRTTQVKKLLDLITH